MTALSDMTPCAGGTFGIHLYVKVYMCVRAILGNVLSKIFGVKECVEVKMFQRNAHPPS